MHSIEPADPEAPLYRHPNVVALPHTGAATEEVYRRFAEVLRDNIVAARAGLPLKHRLC